MSLKTAELQEQIAFYYEGSQVKVKWDVPLDTGETITYRMRDYEAKTIGKYALVTVNKSDQGSTDGDLLGYDTLNLGKSKQYSDLAKMAHKVMPPLSADAYPLPLMEQDLMVFCAFLYSSYESRSTVIQKFDASEEPTELVTVLNPFIIQDAGTIVFAPPGSGKSYVLQSMATSLSLGLSNIWQSEQRPVMYVNLERSPASLQRREYFIRHSLGVPDTDTEVEYMHSRGRSLKGIAPSIIAWQARHNGKGVVLLDSVSRTQMGDLNGNEAANNFIDCMNSFGTWIALGHTPRADATHMFGSTHYDAGQDLGIKLMSERRDGTLGISLTGVKANDIPLPRPFFMALEFDGYGLSAIRTAKGMEFPNLIELNAADREKMLFEYMEKTGRSTIGDASKNLNVAPEWVTAMFKTSTYSFWSKAGNDIIYTINNNS
jgi:hypothetical protein